MIKDSSRPCDGTHFFNEWAAFTTSLNISSESGRTFGDACQLFYCIFAGILDMRKGRKPAWLLGFRLKLTTLAHYTIIEKIGTWSYNIFLIQMLYYCTLSSVVYSIVSNQAVRIIINIFFCVILGGIFYKIEAPITNKITAAVVPAPRSEVK